MTTVDAGPEGHSELDRLAHAAEHLDRWALNKLMTRLHAREQDDSPELDRLTDGAARLTHWERHLLCVHLRDLEQLASGVDDDMDFAETLANADALA